MNHSIMIYILVAFAVSYTIRVLPLTLIKKPITNRFIRSFLYYVPYATLAVMTFPSIIESTQTPISGLCALVVGIGLAFKGQKLPVVASACCITVFLIELVMI